MSGLTPSFEVPAEYFYALGSTMPTTIDAATRLTIAGGRAEAALVAAFQQAIDDGTIDVTGLITPLQAARRIIALAGVSGHRPAVQDRPDRRPGEAGLRLAGRHQPRRHAVERPAHHRHRGGARPPTGAASCG